ncbi:MAG: heme-binding protein [Candidatus Binatia bacterium]
MKSVKLSFDFSDKPQLVEMLRVQAARERTTQKAIVIDALEAYFAPKVESTFLLKAAVLTPSIAHSKAYTAATLRRTSAEVGALAESRPHFFASIAHIGAVPLIAGGGGLPIRQGGEVVGGVGASGGTPDQDVECAQAGLAAAGLQ